MEIEHGGAPAPAAPDPARGSEITAPEPRANPVEFQGVEKPAAPEPAKPEPDRKPVSVREAIEKATAKVAEKEASAKDAPKSEGAAKDVPAKAEAMAADAKPAEGDKPAQPRGEGGKFASPDPQKAQPQQPGQSTEGKPASFTADGPPERFSKDAKDAWHAAPENIRGEVLRMQREYQQGFEKYRERATRDQELDQFHEMAKAGGTTVAKALSEYVNMENLLRSNPMQGLQALFDKLGMSPRQYAEAVLGQSPDQVASHQDATIRELRQTIQMLSQQVGSVVQHTQHQQAASVQDEVNRFAAEHPRFDELSEHVAREIAAGYPLQEAYRRAELLNPVTGGLNEKNPAASSAAPTPPAAQTRAGEKSISGAPSSGLSPASRRQPASSPREALERAMQRAGSR